VRWWSRLFQDRIEPADHIALCPDCSSEGPHCSITTLRTAVIRQRRVVSWESGERFACQRCPCVFSVGPQGVFRHSRQSLPYTPEVPPPLMQMQTGNDLTEALHGPVPRRRPDV